MHNQYPAMKRLICLLFALACFSTATLSSQMLGVGLWFWVILGSGVIAVSSTLYPALLPLAVIAGGCLGLISVVAIVLGLLAATIGGSFNMDGQSALLLLLFGVIAISGLTLVKLHQRDLKRGRFQEKPPK